MAKSKKSPKNGKAKKAASKKSIKKASPKKAAKKKVSKVASSKKSPSKKPFKKKVKKSFAADTDGLVTITYEVKFFGGAGGIKFRGENLDRTESGDTTFDVQQNQGDQATQVGGTAPDSVNGRIEVQVSQDGEILSPFSANTFRKIINSTITYTIQ